jgi:hypothetical protein
VITAALGMRAGAEMGTRRDEPGEPAARPAPSPSRADRARHELCDATSCQSV